MPEPDRPLGRHPPLRPEPDLARVRFIKSAQRLGFSLDEIGDLLKLEDGSHCTEAREQAEKKLSDVRAKLAELTRIERSTCRSRPTLLRRERKGLLPADRDITGGLKWKLLRVALIVCRDSCRRDRRLLPALAGRSSRKNPRGC
jgi:DNA-binding transcriptional MerR regulator